MYHLKSSSSVIADDELLAIFTGEEDIVWYSSDEEEQEDPSTSATYTVAHENIPTFGSSLPMAESELATQQPLDIDKVVENNAVKQLSDNFHVLIAACPANKEKINAAWKESKTLQALYCGLDVAGDDGHTYRISTEKCINNLVLALRSKCVSVVQSFLHNTNLFQKPHNLSDENLFRLFTLLLKYSRGSPRLVNTFFRTLIASEAYIRVLSEMQSGGEIKVYNRMEPLFDCQKVALTHYLSRFQLPRPISPLLKIEQDSQLTEILMTAEEHDMREKRAAFKKLLAKKAHADIRTMWQDDLAFQLWYCGLPVQCSGKMIFISKEECIENGLNSLNSNCKQVVDDFFSKTPLFESDRDWDEKVLEKLFIKMLKFSSRSSTTTKLFFSRLPPLPLYREVLLKIKRGSIEESLKPQELMYLDLCLNRVEPVSTEASSSTSSTSSTTDLMRRLQDRAYLAVQEKTKQFLVTLGEIKPGMMEQWNDSQPFKEWFSGRVVRFDSGEYSISPEACKSHYKTVLRSRNSHIVDEFLTLTPLFNPGYGLNKADLTLLLQQILQYSSRLTAPVLDKFFRTLPLSSDATDIITRIKAKSIPTTSPLTAKHINWLDAYLARLDDGLFMLKQGVETVISLIKRRESEASLAMLKENDMLLRWITGQSVRIHETVYAMPTRECLSHCQIFLSSQHSELAELFLKNTTLFQPGTELGESDFTGLFLGVLRYANKRNYSLPRNFFMSLPETDNARNAITTMLKPDFIITNSKRGRSPEEELKLAQEKKRLLRSYFDTHKAGTTGVLQPELIHSESMSSALISEKIAADPSEPPLKQSNHGIFKLKKKIHSTNTDFQATIGDSEDDRKFKRPG